MATLPDYAKVQFSGYQESFDPSVQVTEMERGPPKRAKINSRVLMQMECALMFTSDADVVAFEDWYFDVLDRVGEFTMAHPRTGQTITAWFSGASIGELIPLTTRFHVARRDVVIEYMR